jgi:DNA-binding CsgD family transcriptional regulator
MPEQDAVMMRLPEIAAATPLTTLTPRDRELLEHLRVRRSQRQISLAMAITVNTVRGRVRRLERKLDSAPTDADGSGPPSPRRPLV